MLNWKLGRDNNSTFEFSLWSGSISEEVLDGGAESFFRWRVAGPCVKTETLAMSGSLMETRDRVAREVGDAILATEAILRVKNGSLNFVVLDEDPRFARDGNR